MESYRLLRSYHAQTQYWKDFDPFLKQKNKAFKDSSDSIIRKLCFWVCLVLILAMLQELAKSMHELEKEKNTVRSDDVKLEVFFRQMIQMSLW